MAFAASLSASAWAHHSRGNFNQDEVVEFQGVITEYTWRNPHTFAKLAVVTDSGETRELLLELNSIAVLSRQGWTRDTIHVGDEVTVFANPDFDPDKNFFYSNYYVLPDGTQPAYRGLTRALYTAEPRHFLYRRLFFTTKGFGEPQTTPLA